MTIKKQQVWRVVIDTATYSNTSKEKVLSLANSSIEKQEMANDNRLTLANMKPNSITKQRG